jgi:radical SAM superfamily enzyme YgiQ (UPF0313 family)
MRVHLVNPSDLSFGISIITPRWAYVLANRTPAEFGTPNIIDELLAQADFSRIQPGDLVGIGIHTMNAHRGYAVGRLARARGAYVVFGGIHTSLYPEESFEHGAAHAVVQGDGDTIWPEVLNDFAHGRPRRIYFAGRVEGDRFGSGRWDLAPRKYMWATVQTSRGCPKHCSFCSVWRIDGQRSRMRPHDDVIRECVELRRRGFRFIFLADDNFYPATLGDIALAERNGRTERAAELRALRQNRLDLLSAMEKLPGDMIFFTQITLEAADDIELLQAMRRARLRGVGVGIEAITPEGLNSVYKEFNPAGGALVEKLQRFAEHQVSVFGAFMFGLPTDRPETFDATADLAQQAGVTMAQFSIITPFPGTLQFEHWAKDERTRAQEVDGVPLTRYWLIPREKRPRLYADHPSMSEQEILERTRAVWKRYYGWRQVWERAHAARKFRSRLAILLASKLLEQMYASTAIGRTRSKSRWTPLLGRLCLRLFQARPMPELEIPEPARTRAASAR